MARRFDIVLGTKKDQEGDDIKFNDKVIMFLSSVS